LTSRIPRHGAAFDQRLIHREDVGIDLRLVGHQRAGGVQNAGIDLPSGAGFEFVGAGEIENFVIAFVPLFETAADVVLRGPGFRPMKV
jgi:hypothetical protein